MHDEVYEATQESGAYGRDAPGSTASSPSEAYANMTLDSQEPRAADADQTTRTPEQPQRPPPRASSPAKRPHSDMDDSVRQPQTIRSASPRPTKPLPSARGTSVDMPDAPPIEPSPASSPDTLAGSNPETAADVPSLDEQVQRVMEMHGSPVTDGQEGYVISERWLERIFSRTSDNMNHHKLFSKTASEGEIGAVDNSDIVDTAINAEQLVTLDNEGFIPLRAGLSMGNDYEIIPAEAWKLIIGWYGLKPGSAAIKRYVHNTSPDSSSENLQYEVYPPIFTIRKVATTGSVEPLNSDASRKLVASRSEKYHDFITAAKKAAKISPNAAVRVWRVLNTAPVASTQHQVPTPESSHRSSRAGSPVSGTSNSVPLTIELTSFAALTVGVEREMVTGKDETENERYNSQSSLHDLGLAEDQVLILEEETAPGVYPSDSVSVASKNDSQAQNNKSLIKVNKGTRSAPGSGRNTPPPSAMMTRGRQKNGRTQGTTGLTNLGNTCYMNSALQCIRSVEELYWYFLGSNDWKRDLNENNPLGHGGAIAKTYASLLASIYTMNSSFAPRQFKNAVGKAAPTFSGYGQQDSQEFLSFLVDGLHEDLNRVKKKPYTENPESDDNTIHDPEAIRALGEKFREIHRARNNSVAMDLFNGFYKNTMVCPDCDRVSITFDPYSLLTLQLPVEQTFQHTVTFVPLRGKMIKIQIDIDKNATIKGIKEYIAKRFPGVKSDHLMGAEIYSNKFYKLLEDDKTPGDLNIIPKDILYFFELDSVPTGWPPRKKKTQYKPLVYTASSEEDTPKSSSPNQKLMVPVVHRIPSASPYRQQSWKLALTPSYIVLDGEEARDYDLVVKKVLGKVAQLTTRPILTELLGTPSALSRNDSDIVLTTEEDALPNGDANVHDGSVEDDMVEVTMSDPEKDSAKVPNSDIYDVLEPGTPIPPGLLGLFDIKISQLGRDPFPTGWSALDGNKSYIPITDRIRSPPSVPSSPDESNSSASSNEDVEDIPQFSVDPMSSMEQANASSEDEIPHYENERPSGRKSNKKTKKQERKEERQERRAAKRQGKQNRANKNYSKKGKSHAAQLPPQPISDVEIEEDDEALVRVGECLVLEWRTEAYDALFGGTANDPEDARGTFIDNVMETLHDPEIDEKRRRRAARKKHGITLDECFDETTKTEVLSEDNAWYCSRCKELRRASKTLEIWTAPDILVLHLKRFSGHRNLRDKVDDFVDFPLEGLDLTGKVGLPEDKSLIYDLFAVDNHFGGLGGGHYTACAKSFFDGKWYDYNDSMVNEKNPESVPNKSAYLLFYRRRQDRPLGPPYLQALVEYHRDRISDGDADEDTDEPTNPGNGLRLGDSSRNGSSSAFNGAGAGVQLGAGSTSAAGILPPNGAAAATADDEDAEMLEMLGDDPPPYIDADEGYADDNDHFQGILDDSFGAAQTSFPATFGPTWGFDNLPQDEHLLEDETYDDGRSDVPNAGSSDLGVEDLGTRLQDFDNDNDMLDFGDGTVPRTSTPVDEVVDIVLGDDVTIAGAAVEQMGMLPTVATAPGVDRGI